MLEDTGISNELEAEMQDSPHNGMEGDVDPEETWNLTKHITGNFLERGTSERPDEA